MAKRNINWKALALDGLLFLLGSISYAVAVDMFTAPNDIAPGGITGIATMLNYLSRIHLPFTLPIGLMTILMNVPLLLAAWLVIGRRMAVRTLCGILLSSVWIDLLEPVLPPFQGEMILTCIFGGALMGLGVGLFLSRGGSTGGSEIVARLLERKFPHIPIGKLVLAVDGAIIALSALVYGQLESPLYAVVLVFISSQVTDWLVYGGRQGKMALIFSKQQTVLTVAIMEQLDRGVTLLKGVGGYTGEEREVLLCAVRPEEVFRLKELVYRQDSDAFFMLLSIDEVRGYGWLDPHEM